jgi:hypothetical protein
VGLILDFYSSATSIFKSELVNNANINLLSESKNIARGKIHTRMTIERRELFVWFTSLLILTVDLVNVGMSKESP